MARTHAVRTLAAGAVLLALAIPARAELPSAYRQLWSDPAMVRKIDQNTEKHRKGDAAVEVVDPSGRPVAGAKVEFVQTRHEFLFGCNAFVLGQFDTAEKNAKYEQAFVRLFNFATVPFYWEGTEPAQGELRYAEGSRDMWRRPPADRYPPWAAKHGITLKGHPLLWHAYNPPWLPKDAEELKKLYQKRFDEISSRYASQIKIWDVVNESLVCSAKYPLFTTDRGYVAWACPQAMPRFGTDNVLMINEVTGVSHVVGEQNRYFPQVTDLLAQGIRIDGIGFQFHLFSQKSYDDVVQGKSLTPEQLCAVYERFASFDRPLYVTEITIPQKDEGPEGEAVQAELVANFYRLWFSAPRMAGVTWWNLGDGTAVPHENKHRGGLINDNLDPKAAYRALDGLINRAWKTQAAGQTDAQGRFAFRGFYGKYAVKVTAGGVTRQFEIDLSKGGTAQHKLTLNP